MEHDNYKLKPTKAIPVSPSELERVQRDFRFNSPAQKYDTAPSPKVGEVWKLERTLPSGLLLLRGDDPHSFINDVKERIRTLLVGEQIEPEFDERPYLYNVERFKSEDPRREIQLRNTHSVAWHPKLNWLLATAGDGNIARVWNVNGEAITKRPTWSRSPGETLSWSSGGELVLSDEYIIDGGTGEYVCRPKARWTTYLRYSDFTYQELRGYHITPSNTSHLSSTNNFSPWRPNSTQLIFGDNERNLILRDGRTGEVEMMIDCDVPSDITDFAWHPKGRFIAVTFEEHNIRIIDIDEAKIVADLSVQHLLGWNPDGKILVARKEKGKAEFVIWDALEASEKPMPEEMKTELWFKRFSKNISADGLRYVNYVCDENHNCSTNIYSVASDELVATLPKSVDSAAWSPVDGRLLATCGGSETHIWKI